MNPATRVFLHCVTEILRGKTLEMNRIKNKVPIPFYSPGLREGVLPGFDRNRESEGCEREGRRSIFHHDNERRSPATRVFLYCVTEILGGRTLEMNRIKNKVPTPFYSPGLREGVLPGFDRNRESEGCEREGRRSIFHHDNERRSPATRVFLHCVTEILGAERSR